MCNLSAAWVMLFSSATVKKYFKTRVFITNHLSGKIIAFYSEFALINTINKHFTLSNGVHIIELTKQMEGLKNGKK